MWLVAIPGELLVFSGQRPGMPLNTPKCTGQPLNTKNHPAHHVSGSRQRNPASDLQSQVTMLTSHPGPLGQSQDEELQDLMSPGPSWASGLSRKGTAGVPKSPGFKVPHENGTTGPTHAGSVWGASRGGGGSANIRRERWELAEWSSLRCGRARPTLAELLSGRASGG